VSLISSSASGSEKDLVLRADSLERLIHWINILTEAASLIYDNLQGSWVKGERVKAQQANPKYILRAVTSPVDDPVEKEKHVPLPSPSLSSHPPLALVLPPQCFCLANLEHLGRCARDREHHPHALHH
jgi:hypothetical protein